MNYFPEIQKHYLELFDINNFHKQHQVLQKLQLITLSFSFFHHHLQNTKKKENYLSKKRK